MKTNKNKKKKKKKKKEEEKKNAKKNAKKKKISPGLRRDRSQTDQTYSRCLDLFSICG